MWMIGYYTMQAWRFVRRWWYVFVVAIAGIAAIFLARRPVIRVFDDVVDQIEAAREEAWIARVQEAIGRDVALDAIKSRYITEAENLNAKERERAKELEEDPAALAHLLLTAGRSRARRTRL